MEHPAAWHPDPLGRHQYRYWDGERWSEHVADDGRTSFDPLDQGEPSAGSSDPAVADDTQASSGSSEAGVGGVAPGGPAASPASGDAGYGPGEQHRPPRAEPYGAGPGPQQAQAAGQWGGSSPAAAGASTNGIAVAALVVGILSLLVSFIPLVGLIGVVGGIVAVILGIIARGKVKQGAGGSGMAIGGIVTGAIAIVIAVLITAALFAFGSTFMGESFSDYNECINETGDEELCQQQLEDDLFDNLRT